MCCFALDLPAMNGALIHFDSIAPPGYPYAAARRLQRPFSTPIGLLPISERHTPKARVPCPPDKPEGCSVKTPLPANLSQGPPVLPIAPPMTISMRTGDRYGSTPAGMRDRAALDDRADVAVSASVPFDQTLFLCGPVFAGLTLEVDRRSCDIDAVLSLLTPDGKVWILIPGHAHAETFDKPFDLSMRAGCVAIPPGHTLRLSLAAAASPSNAVNPESGALAADFITADKRAIAVTIRHDTSCVLLPAVI